MTTPECFFVLGDAVEVPGAPDRAPVDGPLYVERHRPVGEPTRVPVVLVHGGGAQGSDWLTTPDGRPGWAPLLVAAGHTVYVVDRPAHGRSPYHDSMGPPGPRFDEEMLAPLFVPPALGPGAHPTAYRHTAWPGTREPGDPVLAQVAARQTRMMIDQPALQTLERARIGALLERVGPAVVVAHSAGGPGAWLAADAAAEQVAAFVAVETLGPPFLDDPQTGMRLPWGVSAVPLTYEPPRDDPAELAVAPQFGRVASPIPLTLPTCEYRLPRLARFPIAVVTGEASPFRMFDEHLVEFLRTGGCDVDLLRLHEHGVTGNGHGLILETNNDAALGVVTDWLGTRGVDKL